MSETERRKATLKSVKTSEGKPYGEGGEWTVQDYVEQEYSCYHNKELSDEEVLSFLSEYYWDEFDEPSPYFLVEGRLFKKVSEECLDPCYNATATWTKIDTLEVDCTWYNGGAGFEEIIVDAIDGLGENGE